MKSIDEIIDNFNFQIVQDVMTMYPYRWWRGILNRTPTIHELRIFAREQLERMHHQHKCESLECGGFRVERHGDHLELIFVLEQYQTYD